MAPARREPISTLWLWLMAMVPLACGEGEEPSSAPRLPAGWPDGAWEVTDTLLELGAAGATSGPFYRLASVIRLADGSLAVAQATEPIQIYGEDGQLERSFGRYGEGPAEFQSVDVLWQGPGDTIWVGEGARGRMAGFSTRGEFLVSVPFPTSIRGGLSKVIGFTHLGGVLIRRLVTPRTDGVIPETRRQMWYLYDRSADELTPLAEGLEREPYAHAWDGSVAEGEVIFGGRSYAWPSGSGIAVAPAGSDLRVRRLDASGNEVGILEHAFDSGDVTPEDREQHVTWRLQNAPSNADTAAWRRAFRESPDRARFPAIADGTTDETGAVWVRQYAPPFRREARWSVFGDAGEWYGEVVLPNNLTVTEIGSDYVLGYARDELKVETVLMLGLKRSTSSASELR